MKNFLKKYFISGVIVLVPIVATVWVLKTLIMWMDGLIYSFVPPSFIPFNLQNIPGLGLLCTFVIILLVGIFTRLYIGKKMVRFGDAVFARLPLGRTIYQGLKHVLNSTLSENTQKNKRVVLVEYPKENSYAIAFITGRFEKPLKEGQNCLMVFVPTAPNPTSGFLLIVPEESVIPTDITPEEASKIIISGGFISGRNDR